MAAARDLQTMRALTGGNCTGSSGWGRLSGPSVQRSSIITFRSRWAARRAEWRGLVIQWLLILRNHEWSQFVQEEYPEGSLWGAGRRGVEPEEEPLCQVEP